MSKFRCCNCNKMTDLSEVESCSYCGSLMCGNCSGGMENTCPRCGGFDSFVGE